MLSMIIWIYLFLSKCGYIFIKDVSTFLSLYGNVSTFLGLAISLFSLKMWMHLYTRMFPHFRYYVGMYHNFSQAFIVVF